MKRKFETFTQQQNSVLSEIYRRLNYFHSGDLNTRLLLLALPSEAKKIEPLGIIECTGKEIPRVLNWYKLTDKGKDFFSYYVTKHKLSDDINTKLFNGSYIKKFDKKYLNNEKRINSNLASF